MVEVTYFVALPIVATADGMAVGQPMECFQPQAAVLLAEALARRDGKPDLYSVRANQDTGGLEANPISNG